MNLIKINATTSTNSYLKELSKIEVLQSITVVVAQNQTNGRGQINTAWQSEVGKNLTFSVFVPFDNFKVENQFYISKIISVAIVSVLKPLIPSKIQVKWPNDILADGFKIAGILIENSVRKTKITDSIIGVGLNVNQVVFKNLARATSIKSITNKTFDLDKLLETIIGSIKMHIELLLSQDHVSIDQLYFQNLYKFNIPAMYKDKTSNTFMGKIVGVSLRGQLQIELQNETIKEFDLKEIEFLNLS